MAAKKRSVLIIDDNIEEARLGQAGLRRVRDVRVREPADVSEADLIGSSVVLIDYRLSDWATRDQLESICLKPEDGIALAGVLRSYLHSHHSGRPVAFALYSGQLGDLSPSQGPHLREHAIARLNNLEWVFAKNAAPPGVTFVQQVTSLASAVQQLAKGNAVVTGAGISNLQKLLSVSRSAKWGSRAMDDVEECHPPHRDLAADSKGLSLIRWLLHRILPYPCFLLDERYLAIRLRVTLPSLRAALDGDEKLRRRLRATSYSGILTGFLGRRWWRAGVDSLIWTITRGGPFDPDALRKAVPDKLSATLTPLQVSEPVITLDESLVPSDTIDELAKCVEVQPDDWPPYAERAWVRLEDAIADPLMAGLVVSGDKGRLTATDT